MTLLKYTNENLFEIIILYCQQNEAIEPVQMMSLYDRVRAGRLRIESIPPMVVATINVCPQSTMQNQPTVRAFRTAKHTQIQAPKHANNPAQPCVNI